MSARKQKEKPQNYLTLLIPQKEHFVTSIILDINIIMFAVVTIGGVDMLKPSAKMLLGFGAINRDTVLSGEWWRLLTGSFLHAGIYHIVLNCIGIVFAGIIAEPLLGRLKFVTLYLLAALGGSVASVLWYSNDISVGASGAILGCFGAVIVFAFTPLIPAESRRTALTFYGGYAALTLLYGLTPNVDNAAHIGGLITGAIVALLMYLMILKRN